MTEEPNESLLLEVLNHLKTRPSTREADGTSLTLTDGSNPCADAARFRVHFNLVDPVSTNDEQHCAAAIKRNCAAAEMRT